MSIQAPAPSARDEVRAANPRLIQPTETPRHPDIRERSGLPTCDRRLTTMAALVAMDRQEKKP
jgi:hypothetical protein